MASSIAIASGKGGVGKTSIAVNLGLTMARLGRRTVLLDADFGMANAHILIGANPKHYIADALQGGTTMQDVLCDAPYGMKFISGGSGLLEMLNIDKTTRYQAIRMVDELRDDTEVLIADVPAGASDSSIAFVAAADRVVVVLVGEPTSFLDAYSLIKAAHLEAGVNNFSIVVNMASSANEASGISRNSAIRPLAFLMSAFPMPVICHCRSACAKSVVQRKPVSMEPAELPENQAFMKISKAILEAPVNSHGGIRFFADSGGHGSRDMNMRNQYLEQKPDIEELITSHMELVRQIAWHMHGRVRSSIEIEDLIQIGYFGLVTAAQNYSLREGATFASYAGIRIRGAIVDHLRKSSNLCRTTIERQNKANAAAQELRTVGSGTDDKRPRRSPADLRRGNADLAARLSGQRPPVTRQCV